MNRSVNGMKHRGKSQLFQASQEMPPFVIIYITFIITPRIYLTLSLEDRLVIMNKINRLGLCHKICFFHVHPSISFRTDFYSHGPEQYTLALPSLYGLAIKKNGLLRPVSQQSSLFRIIQYA